MMKYGVIILLTILVFIILGLIWWIYFPKTKVTSTPLPSQIAQPSFSAIVSPSGALSFCTPTQLQAQINSQGAAGNIYGNVIIKNISNSECQIIGNNFIQAQIPAGITNITTSHQSQPAVTTFTLSPGQIIYSQIHFPNGPQCSGAPTQIPVGLSYKISQSGTISFTPTIQVPSCANATEKTQLDIWAFSIQPITPQ